MDGKDLMLIPARDPIKFCLQAMDVMFSREEMEKSRFKATRKRGLKDPLPTLDQTKVKLIDGKKYMYYMQDCILNTFSFFSRCHYS